MSNGQGTFIYFIRLKHRKADNYTNCIVVYQLGINKNQEGEYNEY